MARFNKWVTNPIQRLWASWLPPYLLVIHRGRKTGKTRKTPVSGFIRKGTLVVALPYGAESDWVRNVQAAGGGTIVRRGRHRTLSAPQVISLSRKERKAVPRGLRWVARVSKHTLVAKVD